MATATTTHNKNKSTSDVISCGNCLEVVGYLINPVKLQCGHIFCETCLQDHHKNLPDITCFTCEEKTSTRIEHLPSAMGDKAAFCDSCSKRGVTKMSATVYCSKCNMKLCAKHEDSHADVMPDHEMVPVNSHLVSSDDSENKRTFCSTHADQLLSLGCNRCWKICCVRCTTSLEPCTNGEHKLIAIEDLADLAKSKLEPFKKLAEDRFEELSAIVKETTIQISQWDVDTEANVRLIHRTRDKQMEGIQQKYDEVENQYVTSRAAAKKKMTEFIETNAGVKLSEFNDQLKKIRECVSQKHPPELVAEKEKIQAKMEELIKADLPRLEISNQVNVSESGKEYRSIEIQLSHRKNELKLGRFPKVVPTSIHAERTICISEYCNAVCHYKGYTYVGKNNGTIARIDPVGKIENSYISGLANVTTIRAHQDLLYLLYHNSPYKFDVYHVDGHHVRSWNHSDRSSFRGNKICIVQNQIIFANQSNGRLDVYSLSGELIKQTSCSKLPATGFFSIAPTSGDSLIVASDRGVVFTFNHQTDQVTWTSQHPLEDTAVVALNDDYVLLAGGNHYSGSTAQPIKLLNIKTDQVTLLPQTGVDVGSSYIFDMCVNDGTLELVSQTNQTYYKCEMRCE